MWTTKVLFDYDDDQKQPLNLIKETIGFRFTLWTELAEAMNVNSAERFQSHYKSTKCVCVGKIEIVLEIVGESCVWPGCPGFTTTLTTLTSSQEVNAMLYNLTLSDRYQRFDNLIKMIFQSLIGIFRHGRKTSCWGNSGSNICLYHWSAVPQPEERRQVY